MSTVHNNIYKILGEPRRRRILSSLKGNEFSVQEIQSVLGLGQSIISAHLASLKQNNLVFSRRKGKFILYRLNTEAGTHSDILDAVIQVAEQEAWFERDQKEIQKILQRNQEASLSFYEGLEAQNKRSPGQTDHSLAIALMRGIRGKVIVDIGCGNGTLAREFSRRNEVYGVDINTKQVQIAKRLHKVAMRENKLSFIESSAEELPFEDESIDIVVFSHSLHHVEKPILALKECHRVLSVQGLLLILDLHEHNENWLKKVWEICILVSKAVL